MTRGRKPNTIRSVEWKSHIPEHVAAEADLLLLDPVTGKPKHGARSALVARLVSDWIESQRKAFEKETQNV